MDAFLFDSGIRSIEGAYKLTAEVFERRVTEAADLLAAIQREPTSTKSFVEAAFPRDVFAKVSLEQAEATLQVIRQSFLMALYHHWERSVMRWQGVVGERTFKEPPAT